MNYASLDNGYCSSGIEKTPTVLDNSIQLQHAFTQYILQYCAKFYWQQLS